MAKIFELPDLPIRITERGEWLHGDQPLHPRVERLFARNVVPADDGYYVQLGYAKQKLVVADTAFFVKSLRLFNDDEEGLVRVALQLSDGAEENLDPATLTQSADNVLYCRLKRHERAVPCRFLPAQYHDLALHMEMDGNNAFLTVQGKRWPVKVHSSIVS